MHDDTSIKLNAHVAELRHVIFLSIVYNKVLSYSKKNILRNLLHLKFLELSELIMQFFFLKRFFFTNPDVFINVGFLSSVNLSLRDSEQIFFLLFRII